MEIVLVSETRQYCVHLSSDEMRFVLYKDWQAGQKHLREYLSDFFFNVIYAGNYIYFSTSEGQPERDVNLANKIVENYLHELNK